MSDKLCIEGFTVNDCWQWVFDFQRRLRLWLTKGPRRWRSPPRAVTCRPWCNSDTATWAETHSITLIPINVLHYLLYLVWIIQAKFFQQCCVYLACYWTLQNGEKFTFTFFTCAAFWKMSWNTPFWKSAFCVMSHEALIPFPGWWQSGVCSLANIRSFSRTPTLTAVKFLGDDWLCEAARVKSDTKKLQSWK